MQGFIQQEDCRHPHFKNFSAINAKRETHTQSQRPSFHAAAIPIQENEESQLEPTTNTATHSNSTVAYSRRNRKARRKQLQKRCQMHAQTSQCSARCVHTHTQSSRIPNKTPNYMHRQVKFVLSLGRSGLQVERTPAAELRNRTERLMYCVRRTVLAPKATLQGWLESSSYSQLPNTT